MSPHPMKLGHAHLKVRSLDRSIDFYTGFLGLEVRERVGDRYAFLSGTPTHHELALQSLGESAQASPPHSVGLFHLAFEVPDRTAFAHAHRHLVKGGVATVAVDHGISWALYFEDPDGNGVEIYCDTRQGTDGRQTWKGESRRLPASLIRRYANP